MQIITESEAIKNKLIGFKNVFGSPVIPPLVLCVFGSFYHKARCWLLLYFFVEMTKI